MALSTEQRLINRCKQAETAFHKSKKHTLKLVKQLCEAHRALGEFQMKVITKRLGA